MLGFLDQMGATFCCILHILYNWVEWLSTFFRFSKTYTVLLIRHFFRNSIPNNRQILDKCLWESFYFQKITGTLKFTETFYIKEKLTQIKYEIKILLIFISIFQKRAKLVLFCTGPQKYCFEYLLIFSFNKI